MPELNHRFHAGRMNKDLDERLVPNGEYRDALNVQVATSEGSDVGSLQTILGNRGISSTAFEDALLIVDDFYCVGSIVDEKTDKIYWLMSGVGTDIIAEYDYKTENLSPVVVDTYSDPQFLGMIVAPSNESGRVLNFDKSYLITGINIIEDYLFWTDNNTEPKKINITRSKIGSPDFITHTEIYVKNLSANASPPYLPYGPLKHENITIIKKSPKIAPLLEMRNTTRLDVDGDGIIGEISTTLTTASISDFINPTDGQVTTSQINLTFETNPDFQLGDSLTISSFDGKKNLVVEVSSNPANTPINVFRIKIISWDSRFIQEDFDTPLTVTLNQNAPLFQFKFPRFGYRYKYEDGEYSTFSPFSEVAFLPSTFKYLPKEGYNLGMVNNVRSLGVKDFVDGRSIPVDVVSIDILYKESNSPIIYSVKTVNKVEYTSPSNPYNEWNAISPNDLAAST